MLIPILNEKTSGEREFQRHSILRSWHGTWHAEKQKFLAQLLSHRYTELRKNRLYRIKKKIDYPELRKNRLFRIKKKTDYPK